jgi:hypothetical protein
MTATKWIATSPEETEEAQKVCNELYEHFDPQGVMEIFLVREIFRCLWRIERVARVEQATIFLQGVHARSAFNQAVDILQKQDPSIGERGSRYYVHWMHSKAIPCSEDSELIQRYENHADRRLAGYLEKLEQLQRERKK